MSKGKLLYNQKLAFEKKPDVEYSDEDRFFVVWCERTRRLTIKQTHGVALKEAERLSKKNKGDRFYVLSALYEFIDGEPKLPPVGIGYQSWLASLTVDSELSINELLKLPPAVVAQLSKGMSEFVQSVQDAAKHGARLSDEGCPE